MFRRQKARAPQAVVERLVVLAAGAEGREHDVRGQVRIFTPESVADPRADARPSRELRAGLAESDRGIVIDRLGIQRADHRPLVRHRAHLRHQLAEPRAALPVLREVENARRDGKRFLSAGHRRESLAFANARGQVFAAALRELRLRIEEIHLRRRAALEKIDDPLRLRRKVRHPRQPAGCRKRAFVQQRAERGETDAARRALEESAARERDPAGGVEREEGGVVAVHGAAMNTTSYRGRLDEIKSLRSS